MPERGAQGKALGHRGCASGGDENGVSCTVKNHVHQLRKWGCVVCSESPRLCRGPQPQDLKPLWALKRKHTHARAHAHTHNLA